MHLNEIEYFSTHYMYAFIAAYQKIILTNGSRPRRLMTNDLGDVKASWTPLAARRRTDSLIGIAALKKT